MEDDKKQLIDSLKKQLKVMRKESNKASNQGRHSWSDYYRNQHIKELEKQIRQIQSNAYPKKTD
jgi:hypothetical protein